MKHRVLKGWTFHRWIYLLLGLWVTGSALNNQEWFFALFGGYFMSMAVFNFGCAASGGCYGGQCSTDIAEQDRKIKSNH